MARLQVSIWRGFATALFAALCAAPLPSFAKEAAAADFAGQTIEVQGRRTTESYPQGRLGNVVRPSAYRLDLTIDPSSPRFAGQVEIDVVLAAANNQIFLHGLDLSVSRVVAHVQGREIVGTWSQLDAQGAARIDFAEALPAEQATLVLTYDAPFSKTAMGMFHVAVEGEWYSWTQFQATDARRAFPSFDEPAFKTPFTLTMRTPKGLMAIGNAPELPLTQENGLDVHRFAPTLPLPTYLVAMMVGPFVTLEGVVEPTQQRAEPIPLRIVSTRPNAGRLDYALENTAQIVRLLEDYFGDAFPYPKLDQITTPILPGAMENPGADLYRDDLLVMDRNAPISQQREFGRIVAHELAHQWFGDLVTPEWWNDLWLNESFANSMGYLIGQAWRPDLDIWSGILDEGFTAMEVDSLLAGRSVREPIARTAKIDTAFDRITYGKGGQLLAMFGSYLGKETFRDGVRQYLAQHRHGTATSDDFFAALSQTSDDPRVVPAMRSFIEQQGVPLLVFQREADHTVVSQMRYTPLGVTAPDTRWVVPVCVRRGTARECKMLEGRSVSFENKGSELLVPNEWGVGYYRFELSKRHWASLIANAGSLTAGEAMSVADSLYASLLAGRGTVDELARLSKSLSTHSERRGAFAADVAIGKLVRMGVVDAAGRQGWSRLRVRLYGHKLKEYGFDPRAGAYAKESPVRTQWRQSLVGTLLGTPRGAKLRNQLQEAAAKYIAGDHAALDEAWIDNALDNYLYVRGEAAARDLVDRALASEDPVFRPAALVSAARSSRTSVANWLLELDDPRLRATERLDILDGIMARSATRSLGYDWIVANIGQLMASSDGSFFPNRIAGGLGQFCSTNRAEQIALDLRPHFVGTAAALQLERSIERVRNCGVLYDRLGTSISEEFERLK